MNPEEIRRLHRAALTLKQKGYSESDIGGWLAEKSQGAYSSPADVAQAVKLLPDNLLRAASALAQKGFSGADIDSWIAAKTNGAIPTVQALSQQIGAERQAQNTADNAPTTAAGKALAYVSGAVNNTMNAPLPGIVPIIRGAQQAFDPNSERSQAIRANPNLNIAQKVAATVQSMGPDYRAGRDQAQQEIGGFRENNPLSRDVTDVVGAPAGIIPFLASGGTSAALSAPAMVAEAQSAMAPAAAKGALPFLLNNVARPASMGSAIGLLAGAVGAPNSNPGASVLTNTKDMLPYALDASYHNAAFGALLGAGFPALHRIARGGADFAETAMGWPSKLREQAQLTIGSDLRNISPNPDVALAKLDEAVRLGLPNPVVADAGANLGRRGRWAINSDPNLTDPMLRMKEGRQAARAPYLTGAVGELSGVQKAAADAQVATAQQQAGAEIGSAADVRRVVGKGYDAIEATRVTTTSPVANLLKEMTNLGHEVSPLERQVREQNVRMGTGQPIPEAGHGDPSVARVVNQALESRGRSPLTVRTIRSVISALNDAADNAFAPGSKKTDLGMAYRDAAKQLSSSLLESSPEVAAQNAAYMKAKAVEGGYQQGAAALDSPKPEAALGDLRALEAKAGPEGVQSHRVGLLQRWMEDMMAQGENRGGVALSRAQAIANPIRARNGGVEANILDAQRQLYEHGMGSPEAAQAMDQRILAQMNQRETENLLGAGPTTARELSDNAVGRVGKVLSGASRGGGQWTAHAWFDNMLRWIMQPQNQEIANQVGRQIFGEAYTPAMRPKLIEMMQLEGNLLQNRADINRSVVAGGLLAPPRRKKRDGLLVSP